MTQNPKQRCWRFTLRSLIVRVAVLSVLFAATLSPGRPCVMFRFREAAGEPHVLDFGLAKLAGRDPAAPVTAVGEFLGTLAYASPEQARGDSQLIDTRSDVYSLGVILFEMLAATAPYPVGGSISEVLQNIQEAEPLRPSSIRPEVDGEVDTIVGVSMH